MDFVRVVVLMVEGFGLPSLFLCGSIFSAFLPSISRCVVVFYLLFLPWRPGGGPSLFPPFPHAISDFPHLKFPFFLVFQVAFFTNCTLFR